MTIVANSRNSLTDVVEIVDPVTEAATQPPFVDLRERVEGQEVSDRLFTVDSSMTWGSIGVAQMGDAKAWWIVADLSNVVDPFTELTPGTQLRVPSQQRFFFDILAPENTQ